MRMIGRCSKNPLAFSPAIGASSACSGPSSIPSSASSRVIAEVPLRAMPSTTTADPAGVFASVVMIGTTMIRAPGRSAGDDLVNHPKWVKLGHRATST